MRCEREGLHSGGGEDWHSWPGSRGCPNLQAPTGWVGPGQPDVVALRLGGL